MNTNDPSLRAKRSNLRPEIVSDTSYPRNDMRILIAESGSGFGGSAKYLASLIPLINRDKYEIELVAYGSGPFIEQIIHGGHPVHYFPSWRFPWKLAENSSVIASPKGEAISKSEIATSAFGRLAMTSSRIRYLAVSFLQILVLVPVIAFWLYIKKVNLIHLNNEILSHLPILIAARLVGSKVLCHFHGWRNFTLTERLFTQFVNQFVTISEVGAKQFESQLNSGRTMIPIPNGLTIQRELDHFEQKRRQQRQSWEIDDETKAILIVGRLVPWKGHEVFLKALSQVLKLHQNVIGVILGNDPSQNEMYLKKLKSVVERKGMAKQIRFMDWQEDVWSVYAASDIVVHASIDPEPFGLVILEAMLAAKPVIATRGGGVTDLIIHRKSGLLVEPNKPEELATSIIELLSNKKGATELAKAGELRAKTLFSMERNAAMIQEVYCNLVAENSECLFLSRSKWQSQVKEILLKTGTLSLLRNSLSFKVPILMYHKISNESDPFFPSVSERIFRQQMSYVRQNYHVISMDELVKSLRLGEKLPRRSMVVTFDDGNMPTLRLASSILEEFHIPVTVFLSPGPLDENNLIWTDLIRWWLKLTQLNHYSIQLNGHVREWKLTDLSERLRAVEEISHKLKLMNNEERKKAMKQLERDLGVKTSELPQEWLLTNNQIKVLSQKQIKFGGHTMTHSILSRMPLEEARYEIFESKRWLENVLNEKVRHFAYPNGELNDFTAEHESLVAQAGFDSGSSSILGLNDFKTNRYALRRIYAVEESLANFASRLVGIGS